MKKFNQWVETDFQARILDDAPFALKVSFDDVLESRMNVKVEVRPLSKMEANVTLHIAVVEQQIEANLGGTGTRTYYNVLKKMLPDAGGTRIKNTTWLAGESVIVNQSWGTKKYF